MGDHLHEFVADADYALPGDMTRWVQRIQMRPGLAPAGDADPDLFRRKRYAQIVSNACLQALAGPCQQAVLLLKPGEGEDAGCGRFFRGQHQFL
ncbi:hypothetical protein D3C80_1286130 [compost metagenome]